MADTATKQAARARSLTERDMIFLINPHAGTQTTTALVKALSKRKEPIAYFITDSKEAVPTFFATAAKGHQVVVVCGGDGTVNSILPYAVSTDQLFAVYPNGSGDGFAKELGFTRDLEGLITSVKRGHTQCIDVMQVGQHFACNVIGVGFDSYVAREFAKRDTRGFKAYIVESAKAYAEFAPIEATVTLDGKAHTGTYSMITIANTPQFGNNARIAPKADATDGLLDVVLVKPMPIFNALRFLVEVFAGKEDGSKYVSYYKAKHVVIESACSHCQIDGETFLFENDRLEVTIAGQAEWLVV